jgi:hypothetical protein
MLCRNETEYGLRMKKGNLLKALGLAALAVSVMFFASPAAAQDAAENGEPFPLNCEDGTKLTALFSENDVAVTLADGTKLKLPFKSDKPWVLYSDGKHQLAEKGDMLEWTIGKKAATLCSPEDDDVATQFDQPVAIDNLDLPADKANPDAKAVVNCYRFKGFMVKEVDLGEVGAEKLAILPEGAKCVRDDPAEKPVKEDLARYFLGTKGKLVFFQAADGWNGGMPFVVVDATSMRKLFEDSFEGEDFQAINVDGANVTLDYARTYSADCSLYLDGTACAKKLNDTLGLGAVAKLPECGPAYDAEKKRTPDYAKEIEQLPSVISYQATLKYDGKAVTITPRAGETTCRVPD